RRRGARSEGPGGRRLGDRRDHRPADPLHQERRHRRSGPLRHPRSADRELSGLGAWLRPRRLAEAACQARPESRSDGGGGAEPGEMKTNRIAGQFGGAPYKYFGDWTDRVAKGELPKAKPPRPTGVERNIVVTTWDWSTPDKYMHDLIASDRRNPTVNANGPLYGSPEYATDNSPVLDPKTNKVSFFKMPVADPAMPVSVGPGHAGAVTPPAPAAYWGG